MTPKVFISYSWSSPNHQKNVKTWADLLIQDGIEVIIDIYDLREGHDKNAFMERSVADPSIDHVIIFSEKSYQEKANSRKSGVGTETQIISNKVYQQVNQQKFIPIVCEFDEAGNPCLPTYLIHTIWIDFSTPEKVNHNWEQLVRLLYGKPVNEKPQLGKPPLYITDEAPRPTQHIQNKFNLLRQALLENKSGFPMYRNEFLDACIEYADNLRVREEPKTLNLAEKILEDARLLTKIRNHLIDWIILESKIKPDEDFARTLIALLEKLLELKSRPPEITRWSDYWFEAHSIFVYETFLYIVAALIKNKSYQVLHEIFYERYMLPITNRSHNQSLGTFQEFLCFSSALNAVLAPPGQTLYSPAGEFVHKHADRDDIPFIAIIEADLLIFLVALVSPDIDWIPQTVYYASFANGNFPLFLKAEQHKYFKNLTTITGIDNGNDLREKVELGFERFGPRRFQNFHFTNFRSLMNLDKLDTL